MGPMPGGANQISELLQDLLGGGSVPRV
jgi:hypothetical protein